MATAPATPIKREWREISAPEMFTFEKINEVLQGTYLGPEPVNVKGKETTQYVFKCGDGRIRTCLATYDLQSKMRQVELNEDVSITYEGEDHNVKTQGSPMRRFRVRVLR